MENKILLITGASSDVGIELIKKVINKFDFILAHYVKDDAKLLELKKKFRDKIILIC